MDVSNRWEQVKTLKLCFSCLCSGHTSMKCRRRKQCSVDGCHKLHNKLLHNSHVNPKLNEPTQSESSNSLDKDEAVLSCSTNEKGTLLFRVVPVTLYGPNSKLETFALLDEGHSVTLVDSSLMRQLGVKGKQRNLSLQWYGGKATQEMTTVIDLHISGYGKQRKYALRNIYGVANLKLPTQSLNTNTSAYRDLPIKSYKNVEPKVLIGLDHCHLGVPDEILQLSEEGPYAANTPLGWVVFGRDENRSSSSNTCLLMAQPELNLYDLVSKYFETENFGVKRVPVIESSEDVRAKNMLKEVVKVDGRYQCRLLWCSDDVVLPDSYQMALNRSGAIERKMKSNLKFGDEYKIIMRNYISKGYVRKLATEEVLKTCPRTWYLPHFGVVNPNKPGKMRLVFDAAASVERVSLNSKLSKGQQQYRPLPTVLFNFRVVAVGVCGDIREMFHQILVAPIDRCSQRFLWRFNNGEPIDVYEMGVMTFGAACSPCVANFVKEANALQFRDKYPRAVKSIVDHHYVDDFVDCFETPAKAIEIAKQVCPIHKEAGFELRNFTSNSPEVVMALEGVERADNRFYAEPKETQAEKILGMYWRPDDDTFRFNLKFHNVKEDVVLGRRLPTKRELLSMTMSVFDPLGILSHFMITAKLLMREVWRHDTRRDEEIPNRLSNMWSDWRSDLKNVVIVQIPRYYFGKGISQNLELHVFVDASEDAFGAVAYWRSTSGNSEVEVSFIAAKTKCAPMKIMSIPRLELQAAVLGTRLMTTVLKEHSLNVSRVVCWSDSTTVINWIYSEGRRYKPFVAHRIAEILDATKALSWRWLPTSLNVADETTRVKKHVDFSAGSRWFKGPSFLCLDEADWPRMVRTTTSQRWEEEIQPKFALLSNKLPFIEFSRFSTFIRLKRTVAWALRFISRCRGKTLPQGDFGLTAGELETAELLLCRLAQDDVYCREIAVVRSKQTLPKDSELFTLSILMTINCYEFMVASMPQHGYQRS